MSQAPNKTAQSLPTLDNFQLDAFFRDVINHKKYFPCITKDQLDTMAPKQCFGIINSSDTDDPSNGDYHWTCIYLLDPNYAIIFDSYGSHPAESVIKYVRKVAKKFNLTIIHSNDEIQELGTTSCGWYCTYMLLCLLNGIQFNDALETFYEGEKFKENEKRLTKFFKESTFNGTPLYDWMMRKSSA